MLLLLLLKKVTFFCWIHLQFFFFVERLLSLILFFALVFIVLSFFPLLFEMMYVMYDMHFETFNILTVFDNRIENKPFLHGETPFYDFVSCFSFFFFFQFVFISQWNRINEFRWVDCFYSYIQKIWSYLIEFPKNVELCCWYFADIDT